MTVAAGVLSPSCRLTAIVTEYLAVIIDQRPMVVTLTSSLHFGWHWDKNKWDRFWWQTVPVPPGHWQVNEHAAINGAVSNATDRAEIGCTVVNTIVFLLMLMNSMSPGSFSHWWVVLQFYRSNLGKSWCSGAHVCNSKLRGCLVSYPLVYSEQ